MTPTGLAANKKLMDTSFSALVRKGTGNSNNPDGGIVYNTVFDMYFTPKYEVLKDTEDPEDADVKAMMAAEKKLKQDNIDKLRKESHEFASAISDMMKECLDEISNQIDAHIKSMIINIMATTPGPSGTVLTGATGPVTGTIGANNLTPTGGISIS